MTISTRCGHELRVERPERSWVGRWICPGVCWSLDWVDEDHCEEARE